MAGEWIETTLGNVLTLQRGFDLPVQKRRPGAVPVVASTGVVGNHNEPLVKCPGVVVGRSGSIGGAQFIKNDFWPLNTTLWVKDFKGNDPRFVYYLLFSIDFSRFNVGSGVPTLNRNHIHPLPVSVPSSCSEQHAIAHILSTLDDKIELNQQMNRNLEASAQAIFKSWFVDFDPVRAKMEGRQPSGMDIETAALFPDSFEDSPLGKIPKGWRVASIGESVRVVGGGTPSTKEPAYWDGGTIYWATPKDLASLQSPVLLDSERRITELGLQQISSGLLPKGTVLLSSRAPIGYLAISEIPVAINQGFIAIVCDRELPNHYVLYWTRENMDVIMGRANGTTFLEISKANFRPIAVVIPTQDVLERFTNQVEVIHQQVVNNLRQSRTLTAIRDALLPKLMSGEIRVNEAEQLVAAAA